MRTKDGKWKVSIDLYFILMNILVFVGVSIVSAIISALIYWGFHRLVEIPEAIYTIVISIVMGGVVRTFLYQKVLAPINHLSRAMERVAQGDFTVRLREESSLDEMQRLYDNFNVMVGELAATEVLQSDFVSNVSHEFKTPIGAIEGYATLLQGKPDLPAQEAEYTEKILSNTKRLSVLVSNILLLSKVESQIIPAVREQYCLDEQVRQAIVLLEDKWTKKEIDLAAELETTCYEGNEALLLHVWLNLIDNAVKFNPAGGSIFICLKASEQNVLISVKDSGCGISEADRKRIFDKFYQSDTSHKDEGNGLGLALVKRIVAIHQGHIEVENCAEGGCKFTVVLPRSPVMFKDSMLTFPVGVPSPVAVGLGIMAFTVTGRTAFLLTIANALFALLRGSTDRGAVTGKGQVPGINQPPVDGLVQELLLIKPENEEKGIPRL